MNDKAKTVEGIIYRKGDLRGEAAKYKFRYIPHIVIADADGRQLKALEARALMSAHKEGRLADMVISEAKKFAK